MASPQLEAVLAGRLKKKAVRIPPYPAVATRLRKLASGDRVSMTQLATVLASDPALAGMVVARASVAAFGHAPVTTLAGALQRLGIEELIGLALAVDLGRAALASGPLSPLRRDAWRRALLSSRLAQELAPARGLDADAAHLAGLFHDFGAVVVVATLEDIAATQPLPPLPQVVWTELVEKLHVEFGLVTAVRWGLPDALVEVIEHHHAPRTPLGELIHLVDRVIDALDRSPSAGTAGLAAIHDLTPAECLHIVAVIPQVVEQMASFAPPTTQYVPVVLPSVIEGEPAWPIDLALSMRTTTYRASQLSPNGITFAGPESLALNWLTEIVVHTTTGPIKLLANIKRCDRARGGGFQITAQPFALAGEVKTAWLALVDQTRHIADVAPAFSHAVAR